MCTFQHIVGQHRLDCCTASCQRAASAYCERRYKTAGITRQKLCNGCWLTRLVAKHWPSNECLKTKAKTRLGSTRWLRIHPKAKTGAMMSLKRRGYTPFRFGGVLIPKKNGKMRPLRIPTMKCRAMQALHLLALEPIRETIADRNSYGFRPQRSTADAAAQCFGVLSRRK